MANPSINASLRSSSDGGPIATGTPRHTTDPDYENLLSATVNAGTYAACFVVSDITDTENVGNQIGAAFVSINNVQTDIEVGFTKEGGLVTIENIAIAEDNTTLSIKSNPVYYMYLDDPNQYHANYTISKIYLFANGIPENIDIIITPPGTLTMNVNVQNGAVTVPMNMTVGAGSSVRMPVDPTLTISTAAADAKVTGNRIRALEAQMPKKANLPTGVPNGESGQYLRSNGDGTTTWASIGTPTDEQVSAVMQAWLDEHPEATTTVQDGSITYLKLNNALQSLLDGAVDGGYVEDNSLYLTHNGEVVAGPFTGFGGGGGGGGGSGTSNNAIMSMENASGWAAKTVAVNSSVNIAVSWSSYEDGLETGQGALTIKVNSVPKESRSVAQGMVSIDVSDYLTVGENIVSIVISDSYGNTRQKNFNVTVQAMYVTSSFDDTVAQTGAFDFPFTAFGAGRKTMCFFVDNSQVGTKVISDSGNPNTYNIPAQAHGAHAIDAYFTATLSGQIVQSNTLHYDVICLVEGNSTPIIASAYNTTQVDQYSTVTIPFMVYNPASLVSDVVIKVDGTTVKTMPSVDRTVQDVSVRMDNTGYHTITIQSGEGYKNITLNVTAAEMTAEAVTNGLELYLTSTGRSNLEQNPDVWTFTAEGGNTISATMTGFNHVSNGWIRDDAGMIALRLNSGASVTIPFQIFGSNADFPLTGKTIEIEFAVSSVKDYTQAVISCMDQGRGLLVTSQTATLSSQASNLGVQFKDGDHVRISFVCTKKTENRLLMCYINGIPSRVVQYDEQDDFAQLNPTGITISGQYSTVDIYNIRVYNTNLTEQQILGNWIADTQDGEEMLNRYSRNNIYDEYGNIAISKLPGSLPYMVIECPELPQYKGDKKTCTGRFVNPMDTSKNFEFEGCQINVQGTSSAVYARKNYDMQFKSGFETNAGHIDNYQMVSTVKPFNRFVMKADVASSEGANNVELVKLYCELAPYKTREMRADSQVRQGIYGFPIVIFWTNTDTGETTFLGKYNFNFPKRAPAPYGYHDNMESWEFQNNTSGLMLFTKDYFDETMKTDPETGDTKETWRYDYEARFPSDEWVDYSKLQELQSFVYSTYRAEATGDTLDYPVTYDGVTYTNDTAAYRLAKFKNGIGRYAQINSLVFYYLFTEFFLLADSRAKNLFIGFSGDDTDPNLNLTIDRKAVCEPYDMDTALGINNEGSLTFSYSLEDTVILPNGKEVYTGQQSVLWNNVRDAFGSEIRQMYQTMRSGQILKYNVIEKRFEDHQEVWPEAIWIEDSKYKYIYPLTRPDPGKEPTKAYLEMMLGSKVEQRRWWLSNRFKYMDSKWMSGDALAEVIQFRAYAVASLTITPYSDLYVTVKYGSYTGQERTTQGVPVTIQVPIDNLSDTETYVYSASQIADVGDMSAFKLGWADFSKASRIQRIKVGDSDANYENLPFERLSLSNHPILTLIDCRNCVNLGTGEETSVNMSGCTAIEEAYFDNTQITGVTLPNASPIKKLHLPGTVTNLTLRNQTQLTEFVCPSYANITTLWLDNPTSVINTAAIIAAMPANSRVRLFGFQWTLETLSNVTTLFDKLDTMRGMDQNGNNMEKAQVYGSIHVGIATGSQIANIQARYPDATITYDHVTAVIKYYTYDGATLLYTENITDGAAGTYNGTPSRSSSQQYNYTFAGWSLQPSTSQEQAADENATKGAVLDRNVYAAYTSTVRQYTISFVKAAIDGGGTLQTGLVSYDALPVYNGATPTSSNNDGGIYTFSGWSPEIAPVTGNQTYTATFEDSSVVLIYMNGDTVMRREHVSAGGNGTGAGSTPTKNPSTQYTYTFIGWNTDSTATTADSNALNNVTETRTVYAIFSETPRQYTITFVKAQEDGGGTITTKQVAYGTVPTYTGSNPTSTREGYEFVGWEPALAAVTGAATYTAKFSNETSITRALIKRNITNAEHSQATIIGEYAFAGCSSLLTASFPLVTQIKTYAFNSCGSLTTANFPAATLLEDNAFNACYKLKSVSFPNVTELSAYAFAACSSLAAISLPLCTTIQGYAFQNCSSLSIISLPSLLSVSRGAFAGCKALKEVSFPYISEIFSATFSNCWKLEKAYFRDVTVIGSSAFVSCQKLSALILDNSSTIVSLKSTNAFSFANSSFIVYVPDNFVSSYQSASQWSVYSTQIKGMSELPE